MQTIPTTNYNNNPTPENLLKMEYRIRAMNLLKDALTHQTSNIENPSVNYTHDISRFIERDYRRLVNMREDYVMNRMNAGERMENANYDIIETQNNGIGDLSEVREIDIESEFRAIRFPSKLLMPSIHSIFKYLLDANTAIDNSHSINKGTNAWRFLPQLKTEALPFNLGNDFRFNSISSFNYLKESIIESLNSKHFSVEEKKAATLLADKVKDFFESFSKGRTEEMIKILTELNSHECVQKFPAIRDILFNNFYDQDTKELLKAEEMIEVVTLDPKTIKFASCIETLKELKSFEFIDRNFIETFFTFIHQVRDIDNLDLRFKAIDSLLNTNLFYGFKSHIEKSILPLTFNNSASDVVLSSDRDQTAIYISELHIYMTDILKHFNSLQLVHSEKIAKPGEISQTSKDLKEAMDEYFFRLFNSFSSVCEETDKSPSLIEKISLTYDVDNLLKGVPNNRTPLRPNTSTIQIPAQQHIIIAQNEEIKRMQLGYEIDFKKDLYNKYSNIIDLFTSHKFTDPAPNAIDINTITYQTQDKLRKRSLVDIICQAKSFSPESIEDLKKLTIYINGEIETHKEMINQNKILKEKLKKNAAEIKATEEMITLCSTSETTEDTTKKDAALKELEKAKIEEKKIIENIKEKEKEIDRGLCKVKFEELVLNIKALINAIEAIKADKYEPFMKAITQPMIRRALEVDTLSKRILNSFQAIYEEGNDISRSNSAATTIDPQPRTLKLFPFIHAEASFAGAGGNPKGEDVKVKAANEPLTGAGIIPVSVREDILSAIKLVAVGDATGSTTGVPPQNDKMGDAIIYFINMVLSHKEKVYSLHNLTEANKRPTQAGFEVTAASNLHSVVYQTRNDKFQHLFNSLYQFGILFTPKLEVRAHTKGKSLNIMGGVNLEAITNPGLQLNKGNHSSRSNQEQLGRPYIFVSLHGKEALSSRYPKLWNRIIEASEIEASSLSSKISEYKISPALYRALCSAFKNLPEIREFLSTLKKKGKNDNNLVYIISKVTLNKIRDRINDDSLKAKIHIEINPILPGSDVEGKEGFALAHDTFRTLLDTELSSYKLSIADEALLEAQRQQWKHFLDGLGSHVTNKQDFDANDLTSDRSDELRRFFGIIMPKALPMITEAANQRREMRNTKGENPIKEHEVGNVLKHYIQNKKYRIVDDLGIQNMAERFKDKLSIYRIIKCKDEFKGKSLPYNIAVNPISYKKNVIIYTSSIRELGESEIAILQDPNLHQWKHLYERDKNYIWYEEMPEWAFLYAILVRGNEKEQRYYLNPEKIVLLMSVSSGAIPNFVNKTGNYDVPLQLKEGGIEEWKKYIWEQGGGIMPTLKSCDDLLNETIRNTNTAESLKNLHHHIQEGWGALEPLIDEDSKTCKINKLFEDNLNVEAIKIREKNEAEEARYMKTMGKGNSRFHDFASILTSTIANMGTNYGSCHAGFGLLREEKKADKPKENPDKKSEPQNTQRKKSDPIKCLRSFSLSS